MKRIFFFFIFLLLIAAALFFYNNRWNRSPENKDYLTLYGNIDIRQVDLGFRVSGRVKKMLFEEGDFVPENALVATLDAEPYEDQVKEADAQVESSRARLEESKRVLKRREEILHTGAVSREDYDDAASNVRINLANLHAAEAALGVAYTNLNDTKIYAPNPGILLTRIREPGTVVKPADPIYTLSLLSPIWARAYVSERDLGKIYPGMPAEIYTDTPGGKPYQGHVGFISPVAEFTPKTVETTQLRTDLVYRLRIIAENPDRGLRQGMPVTIKLFMDRGHRGHIGPRGQNGPEGS